MNLRNFLATKKTHKYRAKATEVNGIRFHSKKEANRYLELKSLERAGKIKELELQPFFVLNVKNKKIGKCILDFKYFDVDSGKCVYEDVKGCDNALSKWKRKHVKAEYGIDVILM